RRRPKWRRAARKSFGWIVCCRTTAGRPKVRTSSYVELWPPKSKTSGRRKKPGVGIGRLRADEWVGGRADDAAQSHADNRRLAPVVRCGAADLRRSASDPLALGRTDAEPDSDTLPRGAALLADGLARQFRHVSSPQRHCRRRAPHLCPVRLGGNFYDLGNEPPAG